MMMNMVDLGEYKIALSLINSQYPSLNKSDVNEVVDRAIAAESKLAEIEKQEEPIKWQSTTEAYIPYLTQSRYEKLSTSSKKWYQPYIPVQPSPAVPEPVGVIDFNSQKQWVLRFAENVDFEAGQQVYLQPPTKPQRITEQDAREIIKNYMELCIPFKVTFESWMSAEGEALLAKLNEHREPDYRRIGEIEIGGEILPEFKKDHEYWCKQCGVPLGCEHGHRCPTLKSKL